MRPQLSAEERALLRRLVDASGGSAPPPELAPWLDHPAVAGALASLIHAVRTAGVAPPAPGCGAPHAPAAASAQPPEPGAAEGSRVAVYLLIDTSGSMRGEPIEAVQVALESMLVALRQDDRLEQRLNLALITFDREARLLVPLTALGQFELPPIETPKSGPTHTGEALRILCEQLDRAERQGFAPADSVVFIMTDGRPSDAYLFEPMIAEVHQRAPRLVMACAVGPKAPQVKQALLPLTDRVGSVERMDVACFQALFSWVNDSLSTLADEGPNVAAELPPPPEEIRIV